MKLKPFLLSLVLILSGMVTHAHATTLKVLVLYTDDLLNYPAYNSLNAIKAWTQSQVAYANLVYSNSGMSLNLDPDNIDYALVGNNPNDGEVSIPLLNSVMSENNSTVMGLRSTYAPDLTAYVTLYPDSSRNNRCGWAYKPNPPVSRGRYYYVDEMAFDAITVLTPLGCPGSNMTHEFGHLMGADHSVDEGDVGHPYPDSLGYGVYNHVNTVMVVDEDFYGSVTQALHSNTNAVCTVDEVDYPCGSSNAKAAKRILQVAQDYVRHFSACWPSVTINPPRGSSYVRCH